ncbi:MAG: 16S rRNA (cytosine(1402)-N(4))-methyltransferase RsmH [Sedimentisphaerales bacterium]|nr:16S rRNA (cytosine(1402)-N(4))-methyltransferase RsmH [Sedimentisphaerales bacterium]
MCEPAIVHIPVLQENVLNVLQFPADAIVVDATIGQAGHALALGQQLNKNGLLIGLDIDENAIKLAQNRLKDLPCRIELHRENFGRLDTVLAENGHKQVNIILADLGFNSEQVSDAQRGLSFLTDGPLDMRLDNRLPATAADLVNTLKEKELADLIFLYSQERKSRRIARAIVYHRRHKPIERTTQLVDIIFKATGTTGKGRKSKIHPATRTFQALRIAVNDELGQLEKLLKTAPHVLCKDGRIAVISFHSMEDRIVKYNFRDNKKNGLYDIITKKPIIATEPERKRNPRSRSAKLRAAKKL